ncbi:pleiotropic drug resistance protein [Trifolium repens]|nr:pleiotropic drug resistance protein [Trifolium repens]
MESGIDVEGRFRGSKRSFKFDSSSSLRISGEADNIFPNSVNREDNDDEEALKWAAIQRLPTVTRLRRGLLITPEGEVSEIDVHELGLQERKYLLERLVRIADIDNEKLLLKFRDRVNRVGIKMPTIEVRFEHMKIKAEVHIGKRASPTLTNYVLDMVEAPLNYILRRRRQQVNILNNVSGIIKPGRMTLLLGPPSSGKTTLLLALAGKLDPKLKFSGKVTYNGHEMNEFVPQRTAAYVSQNDLHIGELTVRETLEFSARFQGVGLRYDMLEEVSRREKERNIIPDPDIDVFMKAIATGGQKSNFVIDYYLKILGLETCADTVVGNAMLRGVSGGQRKRVTTGEMLVGTAKALFMDEISTGFMCPKRKSVADFLQEVTSMKDQEQYWAERGKPYRFVTPKEFAEAFESFHVGRNLCNELVTQFDKSESHPAALATNKYGTGKWELFKACLSRELLLMKRNSFIYKFKLCQLAVMAIVTMTVFLRTEMHHDSVIDGGIYAGALFFGNMVLMFNGFAELSMTVVRLPVFYKHRDMLFYPSWAYGIPSWILKIPITIVEAVVWTVLTYFTVGYDPEVGRLFRQFLLLILINQMGTGLSRFLGAVGREMTVANTLASFIFCFLVAMSGLALSRDDMKKGWIWGFWISPIMYAQNGLVNNEFLGKTWRHVLPNSTNPLGVDVLKSRGFFTESYFYWICFGALIGYTLLFNLGYILALTYLNPIEKHQVVKSEQSQSSDENGRSKSGMVLPFEPHYITFDEVSYSVDMPQEMRSQGVLEDKLVLLNGVSGAFRPGVLTALMGVTGAGKTTLMDVLAGRKTGGYITGNITISGYPKKQETFARISGYCEQNDIHSPHITVYESLLYSAWLRLPAKINTETRKVFVEEVMELVELTPLRDAYVGLPGINGLSTEQRKRLTIAVELVGNPSIIFMDEPTSGLDARAAAIVMRTVRNIVDTGRTIVCTIHQPSIDIFESFDELFLMKRGGQEIYVGPLGRHSSHLIKYFERIQGVSKIKDGYNPATWMLEVTSSDKEVEMGINFAEVYRSSKLYRRNKATIEELSTPYPGSKSLYFPSKFIFTIAVALLLGSMYWKVSSKIENQKDFFNAMGFLYTATLVIGVKNCNSVQSLVGIERVVFYRERAAGMYSSLAYAVSQALIEVPYNLLQTLVYGIIVYPMLGYEWSVTKIFWYIFFVFFTFLYYTYFGMMTTAMTPNLAIAALLGSAFNSFFNLFCGFLIPQTRIPIWWRWFYWINPAAWTLNGLVTSQFGDIKDSLDFNGRIVPIQDFLRNYFGFKYEFLGIVAVIVVGFTISFVLVFAICIKKLNFQRR